MIGEPSRRALAIAEGLIRTGRASGAETDGGYLRVRAAAGGLRQQADELQPGFVNAMARAGV